MPSLVLEIGWYGFGSGRSDNPPRRMWMIGPLLIVVSRESLMDRERWLNRLLAERARDQ